MTAPSWKAFVVAGALSGLPACWTSCVARGARVRTPTGARRIEELAVGDLVLSFDPDTGEAVAGAITAIRSAVRETVRLEANGIELCLTSDHPVYCPVDKRYAPAGDWALGTRDRLWRLTDEGPRPVPVTSTALDAGLREVFDLTVDTPHHNFLAEGVLVHNKSVVRSCDYEGENVSEYSACDCPGSDEGAGDGHIVCVGEVGTCDCPTPDGGSPDAG